MWLLYVQLLGGQNRYGLVCAVIINPLELSINDEARNEVHIASTGVQQYQHKKWKGKLLIRHKISEIKHVEIGQY